MRLFSKSLAIGLPASRVDAYLRRPDSVRVYWTTLSLIHEFSDLTMGAMTLSLCLVVGYIENKLQLIR